MDKIIASLLESPLFNLSLSSKELFHSNLLYWIGKNYPNETGEFFSKYCQKYPEDKHIISVKREKDNIDFSFEYPNGQEVFIENKVKSLVHLSQLERYSNNTTENKNYILLSLSKPTFEISEESSFNLKGVNWFYLSYSDYNLFIEELSNKARSSYHQNLFKDYNTFITGLVEIEKISALRLSDKFDFHSTTFDKIYKSLIDLRLHDFYLKRKYESLCNLIFLNTKECGLTRLNFGEQSDWETEIGELTFGSGMTNSQGLSDIKFKVATNLLLGIQIQGENFRLFIEDKDGGLAYKVKEILLDKSLWFTFSRFGESAVYPKGLKGFNKYGNTFYYKSVKLGAGYSVEEIVNIVVEYLTQIRSNLSIIKNLINKTT